MFGGSSVEWESTNPYAWVFISSSFRIRIVLRSRTLNGYSQLDVRFQTLDTHEIITSYRAKYREAILMRQFVKLKSLALSNPCSYCITVTNQPPTAGPGRDDLTLFPHIF